MTVSIPQMTVSIPGIGTWLVAFLIRSTTFKAKQRSSLMAQDHVQFGIGTCYFGIGTCNFGIGTCLFGIGARNFEIGPCLYPFRNWTVQFGNWTAERVPGASKGFQGGFGGGSGGDPGGVRCRIAKS